MTKNFTAGITFALLLATATFASAEDLQPSEQPLTSTQSSIEEQRLSLQARLEEHLKQAREKLEEYKELIDQVNREGGNLSESKKIMIRQLITSIPQITFEILSTEDIISIMEGSTLIFYHPEKRVAAEIEKDNLTLDTAVSTDKADNPPTLRKDMGSIEFFDKITATADFKTTLDMIARNEIFNKDHADSLQLTKQHLTEHKNHIAMLHIEAQKQYNQHYILDDHLQTLANLDPDKQSPSIQNFAYKIALQRQQYLLQTLKDLISPNELTDSELEKSENLEKLEQYLEGKKKEADNQINIMEGIEEKILSETLLINEIDRILKGLRQ
ncbi:MAG: hypothetical protein K0M45_07005 [Candidatus Paracaedibacteraceae bacterium]|nr:hypothetical protein [Candidatus Paracaedibacteraceae bacterium]